MPFGKYSNLVFLIVEGVHASLSLLGCEWKGVKPAERGTVGSVIDQPTNKLRGTK